MFPGAEVEIGSRGQRDALLEEHGLTHDSCRYVRRPQYKAAVEEVTLDDVREGISRGLHIKDDGGAEELPDFGPTAIIPTIGGD